MKIAINKSVIGKPSTDEESKQMTFTYDNVDLNQDELADYINLGYAFCAQHENKHRKSSNFTQSGFLAVDIDYGMAVQDALDHDFVKNYGAILYTTQSHTEDFPRFRIVFELENPITSSDDMKNAYRGIIKKFGGDPSCKDACRQFYGSKNSNPLVFNNILPTNILDEIILLGSESKQQVDTSSITTKGERHSIVSKVKLDIDDLVTDSEGNIHRLQDIPVKTSIYCPVHADKKPSAFIVKSKKGVVGVHCSKCSTTYYTSSDIPLYDFNYGLRNLTELSLQEYEIIEEDKFFTYSHIERDIIKVNEQYLYDLEADESIILAKSSKGTGKTKWLESIVKRCKEKKLSVLLIGHRQSLIQSVAQRLGLTPYIYEYVPNENDRQSDRLRTNSPTKYYAICADSLSTLLDTTKNKYDVILIDEVEQVFSHLTSNTLKDKRNTTFLHFKYYINSAKQVYVMDADLNKLTVDTLWHFIDDKEKKVKFIINEYSQKDRKIALYADKKHLLNELAGSIENHQRCFVCSNSKKQVHKLEKYIVEHFGAKKKVMAITSDNSQDAHIQDFIRNIKTEILNYDVVIVSPSVGTGVDITFPDKEQKIDVVYGIFEARVNTHFDMDQQISRVRHPKSIKVWVSPETFRFDIDPNVIRREVELTDKSSRQIIGIEPDGTHIYNINDEYLTLYANVKSMQRGSKNNLRHHLKKLKEHEGWIINEIDCDDDASLEGKEINRRGKFLVEQERIEKILTGQLITKDEYIDLKNAIKKKKLTDEEESAMRRYEIESFYYQDISKELITDDKDGKKRNQIRMYEHYTKPDSELLMVDRSEDREHLHKTDKKTLLPKKKFLHQLFTTAGLADKNNDFITNKPIQSDSLSSFADFCIKNKETIARWFEIDIRNDIQKKPAQQLSQFLRLHGIIWKKLKPINKNGTKIYQYEIEQSVIDEMNIIVDHRNNASITQKWHDDRDSTIENHLFESEFEEGDDFTSGGILSGINL